MNKTNLKYTKKKLEKIRWDIINQSYLKKSGHLGGCLSSVDIIYLIYKFLLKKKRLFCS